MASQLKKSHSQSQLASRNSLSDNWIAKIDVSYYVKYYICMVILQCFKNKRRNSVYFDKYPDFPKNKGSFSVYLIQLYGFCLI